MADRIPSYPTIPITPNSDHGVGSDPYADRGGRNANENSGMSFTVKAVPSVGPTTTVKEFPQQVAGIAYGGDHDVVNPMDTD